MPEDEPPIDDLDEVLQQPTEEELEDAQVAWWDDLNWKVSRIFTPAVPVSESDLFAGRLSQVNQVIDAINQSGQHAVIYGERGVGKTSLANVLSSRVVSKSGMQALAPRVNCDSTDTFDSVWRKVLSQIAMVVRGPGFDGSEQVKSALALVSDAEVTPDVARQILSTVGSDQLLLIILDEFDRITSQDTRRAIADTIKTLSDHAVPATLVIVGVAETVGDLLTGHQSIERALIQVPMPRMKQQELHEILQKGTSKLGMRIDSEATDEIAKLSQGLPNYTHRLGLHSARVAIAERRLGIAKKDVRPAIKEAVAHTQQSLRDDYRKAITSPQTGNLYAHVLLACVLARTDSFGYFAAADVRDPMSKIMHKRYEIPSFARHLNDFCEAHRGCVLRREGIKRKYRYRFKSPLMQPFVLMKGIIDEHVGEEDV